MLAEHDRHAGLLNEDQEAFVQEAAEDLVEELGESAVAASDADDAARRPIDARRCIAARATTPGRANSVRPAAR